MIIPNRPRALRFLARTKPALILLGLAAAATTAAVPASASTVASPVIGYTYVDGNTARPIPSTGSPGTPTARLPRSPVPRSAAGARAWARASPPRARSR